MRTLHFDCPAGISGDMTLGALVDLGADAALLQAELEKLKVPGWRLEFRKEERCGITGTRAIVEIDAPRGEAEEGAHHHHHHDHDGDGGEGGECGSRSWRDIREIIVKSGISGGAKERALAIFSRIAAAEAEVHGVPPDEVAFHEVGALDSIIDIVGAAVCLDLLKPQRISASAVELGGGTVRCAHGTLFVPAPATLKLCEGLPVKTGGFDREMTTPTGAAILAASADEFIEAPRSFRLLKTAYGVGSRKLDKPNVLAVSWREESPVTGGKGDTGGAGASSGWNKEELTVLETNIDDMTGEALGFLMDRLFEAGALDVTFTACVMKKSRPGVIVSVLCPPAKLDALRAVIFGKSSAIGLRETVVSRLSLPRESRVVRCGTLGVTTLGVPGAPNARDLGEAEVKTVLVGGGKRRSKVEYRDRERIARELDISLEEAGRLVALKLVSERLGSERLAIKKQASDKGAR